MLKIDNNKSISYINTIKENNSSLGKGAETKLVKLLDSYNQGLTITDNVYLEDGRPKKAAPSIFSIDNVDDVNKNAKEKFFMPATDNQLKLIKFTGNVNQSNNAECNENKEPNVVRNNNILPEYETKMNNREHLDLDHLVNSEINDPNEETPGISNEVDEYKFDGSKEIKFENDDFVCGSYKFDSASVFQTCLGHSTIINQYSMLNKDGNITEDDNLQNKPKTLEKSLPMCEEIDKMEATDIIKKTKENFEAHARNTPRDDSTIDSGFENEMIQAQTLHQIFFNELSNTFKVLYKFM